MKGCQGSNQEVLVPSFLRVISLAMMVSIGMGCCFGGKGFSSFGIMAYKCRFQNEWGVTWFICESFEFRGLVCIILSD